MRKKQRKEREKIRIVKILNRLLWLDVVLLAFDTSGSSN